MGQLYILSNFPPPAHAFHPISPPYSLVFPLHIFFCPNSKLIFLCPRCLVQMEHLLSLTQQAEAVTQIESYILETDMFPLCDFASYLMVPQVTKFSLMLSYLRLTPFPLGRSCEREMDSLIIRFRTRRDKRKTKDALSQVTAHRRKITLVSRICLI